MVMGMIMTYWSNPPHILVDGQGKLVGLFDGTTLHVSSTRRGKFTAETWKQHLAALEIKELPRRMTFKDIPILIADREENQPCEKGAVLIRLEPSQNACPESLLIIDWYDLWRRGGHAVWLDGHLFHVKHVNTMQGDRPWTRRAIPRKDRR
jgi:competence protein ComEC